MELLLISTLIALIFILYYKSVPESFENNITITKNGPNISFFFENENKSKSCSIKIINPENNNVLKSVDLDLDPEDRYGRYDMSLLELKSMVGKKLKLKTTIKIGNNTFTTKFKLKLDDMSKTQKVMCLADGSITYGDCYSENMPNYNNFFSSEKKHERELLMKKLKKTKHYKIII